MKPPFDLNLLRVLVLLEQTRNVTRAAIELGMSQSGFSTALARLREQCGDSLFVRTAGGMAPTPRAVEIAATARRVLSEVQLGVLDQPVFDAATAQTDFRLALADVAEIVFLPRLLRYCREAAPNVKFTCSALPSGELCEAMEGGRIDLALGYFPDLNGPGFHSQRLYDHTYACMLRKDHPALKSRLTARSFSELGHAVVASPSRTTALFDRFLSRHKIERKVTLQTQHHMSLPAIIEDTDLVATVPLATGDRFSRLGAVQLVPLPFPPPVFAVQQHWHARVDNDPRIGWLRKVIAELFDESTDEWRVLRERLYPQRTRRR